jgi:hypothetical protein
MAAVTACPLLTVSTEEVLVQLKAFRATLSVLQDSLSARYLHKTQKTSKKRKRAVELVAMDDSVGNKSTISILQSNMVEQLINFMKEREASGII